MQHVFKHNRLIFAVLLLVRSVSPHFALAPAGFTETDILVDATVSRDDSDNYPALGSAISIPQFRELVSSAVSDTETMEHVERVVVCKGIVRWVNPQFVIVYTDAFRAGWVNLLTLLIEEVQCDPDMLDEEISAQKILSIADVNDDIGFIINLFAVGVYARGWLIHSEDQNPRTMTATGISTKAQERQAMRKIIRNMVALLRPDKKSSPKNSLADHTNEREPYEEFENTLMRLDEDTQQQIAHIIEWPEDCAPELLHEVQMAQHIDLLKLFLRLNIIPPENLLVPILNHDAINGNESYSPFVQFVALAIKPETAYSPNTIRGKLFRMRKQFLGSEPYRFYDPRFQQEFIQWIRQERNMFAQSITAMDQMFGDMKVLGFESIPIMGDIDLIPAHADLLDEFATIIGQGVPGEIIEEMQSAVKKYGFEEIEIIWIIADKVLEVPGIRIILRPHYLTLFDSKQQAVITPQTPTKMPIGEGLNLYDEERVHTARIEKQGDQYVVYRFQVGNQDESVSFIRCGQREQLIPFTPFRISGSDEHSVIIQSYQIAVLVEFARPQTMITWEGFECISRDGQKSIWHTPDATLILEQNMEFPDSVDVLLPDGTEIFSHRETDIFFNRNSYEGNREIIRSNYLRFNEHKIAYDQKSRKLSSDVSCPDAYFMKRIRSLQPGKKRGRWITMEIRPLPPATVEGFHFKQTREFEIPGVRKDARRMFNRFETRDGLISLWQNHVFFDTERLNLITADGVHIAGTWLYENEDGNNESAFLGARKEDILYHGADYTYGILHNIRYDETTRALYIKLWTNGKELDVRKTISVQHPDYKEPVTVTVRICDVDTDFSEQHNTAMLKNLSQETRNTFRTLDGSP
ncbi:MAG: hypothetical protein GF384_04435 [Elusimicrobia bacterium]|nr:hypothetical protein [Elusimicrobiota bacterium]MBD3412097.1 hypothetical protein [Elusimicrobiota bacterium]